MDHYSAENFMLTQSVGSRLSRARHLLMAEMDAALRDLGISSQQMGILLLLERGAAHMPRELSRLLGIDTGLMTRMLDKLEAKQWLARSRSAADRRVVTLALTDTGSALATRIPDIAPQVLNARLKHFTLAEFNELQRLLDKFVGA
jgi:DNA-binding MarR family transcriptional regulator